MKEKIYNRKFQKFIAVLSFVCFAVSLIVHLFAVFGVNVIENKTFYFLFSIFNFIPFGILIVVSQSQFKLYKLTAENNYQKWFFAPMPKWIKYAAYCLSIYIALNFIFCLPKIATVKAEIINEKYVLVPVKAEVSQKNVIREISAQEYDLQKSYSTRYTAGFWMIFYLMPALFFWFDRKNENWTTHAILTK